MGARLVLESFHGARILGSFAGALPKALQRLGLPEILAYQQILVIFSAVGAVYLILFSLLKEVSLSSDQWSPLFYLSRNWEKESYS